MTKKKINFALIICSGLLVFSSKLFAQTAPTPPAGGPPPPPNPPPSPVEVFNKINPFKKKSKTDTAKNKANTKPVAPAASTTTQAAPTPPAGGPPPPPNPLNLFKRKKDTTKKATPAASKPPL